MIPENQLTKTSIGWSHVVIPSLSLTSVFGNLLTIESFDIFSTLNTERFTTKFYIYPTNLKKLSTFTVTGVIRIVQ